MWQARINADSKAPSGARLTTWVLTYPRFIHSELMTHREFSRNSSSSRAIPIAKMIEQVVEDPAMPVGWGKNQKGMQAGAELEELDAAACRENWLRARDEAVGSVRRLQQLGLHKQISNRLLEPWMWITVVVSMTDHANLFHLRNHIDAQPEFQFLAKLMYGAFSVSKPRELQAGEWHLPFSLNTDSELSLRDRIKVCTGRIARTSHLTHDGKRDPQADVELHDRLLASGHWSPFEHCAMAAPDLARSGNFVGFVQYRKMFADEYRSSYTKAVMPLEACYRLALEREKNAYSALRHARIAVAARQHQQTEAFLDVAIAHLNGGDLPSRAAEHGLAPAPGSIMAAREAMFRGGQMKA